MALFPKLIDRTRFNRCSRGLFKVTNLIRRMINQQMGVEQQEWPLQHARARLRAEPGGPQPAI